MRCTGPFGRGTLRGELAVGAVLRALVDGPGTLRFIAVCEGSVLTAPPDEGGRGTFRPTVPPFALRLGEPLLRLCGGRGTLRPAGAGVRVALASLAEAPVLCGVSGPRAVELPALRAAAFSPPRETAERADAAGGVMRLTVGRENAAEDGRAAVSPLRPPSMACRVGLASTRPRADALFN